MSGTQQHSSRVASRSSVVATAVLLRRMYSLYSFVVFLTLTQLSNACPAHSDTAPIKRGPAPLGLDISEAIPFPFSLVQEPVLTYALKSIEDIPETVLDQGEDATREWLTNANNDGLVSRSVIEERQGWIAIAKCALEIVKAIAENGFPIAKLRRFKDLITLLGGAKAVAKMLLKAKSIKEFLIIGGPELVEMGQLLLGLRSVVDACFSWV